MEQVKKKVLILGSKGMAGHVNFLYLKGTGKYNVLDISRNNDHFKSTYLLDVTNIDELKMILKGSNLDVVINCIGILNQEAEDHPEKAVLVNSYLPHFLAQQGLENNFKLIHISTDCVFSGSKGGYTEIDNLDGKSFYARSKALGEVTYGRHLTLRTSIIGPELKTNGIGLFDWFMKQEGIVKGYTKVMWTGVTTLELAKSIERVIDNEVTGLYHLVNNTTISKFSLLRMINNVFRKGNVIIEPYDNYTVDKSLIDTLNYLKIGDYADMIREMKEWLDEKVILYPSYNYKG